MKTDPDTHTTPTRREIKAVPVFSPNNLVRGLPESWPETVPVPTCSGLWKEPRRDWPAGGRGRAEGYYRSRSCRI